MYGYIYIHIFCVYTHREGGGRGSIKLESEFNTCIFHCEHVLTNIYVHREHVLVKHPLRIHVHVIQIMF